MFVSNFKLTLHVLKNQVLSRGFYCFNVCMKVQETKLRRKCFSSGNMSNCRSKVDHTLSNCISIDKIISYLVKYLDSIVLHITHDYPSITKTCCRNWIIKLAFPATFSSKFCNKLSSQFKYLNSVIPCITDH